MLGRAVASCFEDRIESSEDLLALAVAQVDPGVVRGLLGVELLGRGGTAYAVCLETGEGGGPVGRICLDEAVDGVEASGPGGLKDFDFWILEMSPVSACFLLRKR